MSEDRYVRVLYYIIVIRCVCGSLINSDHKNHHKKNQIKGGLPLCKFFGILVLFFVGPLVFFLKGFKRRIKISF